MHIAWLVALPATKDTFMRSLWQSEMGLWKELKEFFAYIVDVIMLKLLLSIPTILVHIHSSIRDRK